MITWRLEVFEELGSTSDFCVLRARAGEPAGLAVQALKQTSGRGSRGRHWLAPEGNLNLSVLLRPACLAAQAGTFSLLAGIAVAQALEKFSAPRTMLKWPNDVLLGVAKLAGVLIDAAPAGQHLDWLVIGIGVNLQFAPQISGRATTALAAHGVDVSAPAAAAAILAALSAWCDADSHTVQQAWLARTHPVGTKLEVRTAQHTLAGVFAGLSPSGELLLQTKDRIERISTGDVLLGLA